MRVNLSIEKNRIRLQSGWAPSIASDCKSVSGATFSKVSKTWSYPLSMASLHALRRVFGDDLAPTEELLAWARTEVRRLKYLKHHASVHDSNLVHLPKVSPTLAEAMKARTYQRSAARFAVAAGSFLLADEPGLGKTATALGCLMESQLWHGDHLVIAPKSSLSSVWGRQIEMWGPDASVFVFPETAAARKGVLAEFLAPRKPGEVAPRFLVVNPASIRRVYGHFCKVCEIWEEDTKKGKAVFPLEHHLEEHSRNKMKRQIKPINQTEYPEIIDHSWTSVILDESHALLAAYKPSNVSQSVQGLLDLKTQVKYALTGTPLRGREERIWGTLDWLGEKTGGYWGFVGSYFDIVSNGFGKKIGGVDEEKREALQTLLDRYVLRRTRMEVRGDLPMGSRVDVLVEMTPKQRKQYETFEKMGEVELAKGSLSGQGTLSEMTRLRQLAFGLWETDGKKLHPTGESPKIEFLIEWLEARGVSGSKENTFLPERGSAFKYVVGSQFTEILGILEKRLAKLGIEFYKITGDVPLKRRTEYMKRFQSEDDGVRVMLIQTMTGGVAIELDAWCDEMVILDETFVADDQKQLEGRTDNRSGRVAPRTWTYIRTADTIEQRIAEQNYNQQDLQHLLLDGRRGVELALHLLGRKK